MFQSPLSIGGALFLADFVRENGDASLKNRALRSHSSVREECPRSPSRVSILLFEFHAAPLRAICGVGGRLVGGGCAVATGLRSPTVGSAQGAAIFDRYSCCPAAKVRSTRSRVSSAAGRGGENRSRGRR